MLGAFPVRGIEADAAGLWTVYQRSKVRLSLFTARAPGARAQVARPPFNHSPPRSARRSLRTEGEKESSGPFRLTPFLTAYPFMPPLSDRGKAPGRRAAPAMERPVMGLGCRFLLTSASDRQQTTESE